MRAHHQYGTYRFFLTPEEAISLKQSPLETDLLAGGGLDGIRSPLHKKIKLEVGNPEAEEGKLSIEPYGTCWEDASKINIIIRDRYIQEAQSRGASQVCIMHGQLFFQIERPKTGESSK